MTEWRYLPSGSVVHALTRSSDAGAVCGVYALPASDWRGTGSQVEYEIAKRLPCCKKCLRKVAAHPTTVD